MKRKITSLLAAAFLACGLLTFVGCQSGCKSTTKTAYRTSGVTHVTVASGLRGWNDYLAAKDAELKTLAVTDPTKADAERAKIGEQNAKVKDAYNKYQHAQVALLTAAQEFSKIPPNDPNAPAGADRLSAAVAAATATMGSVLALLADFGITVK